jgi:hypothetical protein
MPEGQHSFILGAGRVPEVDQAIQPMGQWLRRHLAHEQWSRRHRRRGLFSLRLAPVAPGDHRPLVFT